MISSTKTLIFTPNLERDAVKTLFHPIISKGETMTMIPVAESSRKLSPPIVTWIIITINVLVFFYFLLQGVRVFEKAIITLGMIPWYIIRGRRLYTLITSMFMHGSLEHLFGNMIYLYVFGPGVENRLGKARYLALYFLSGLFADFIHILINVLFTQPIIVYGPFGYSVIDPLKIPCVGASGAISGILGAYFVLLPNVHLDVFTMMGPFPFVIRVPAAVFIFTWFIYQLYLGVLSLALPAPYYSGIAFWAHIGGWIGGLLLGLSLGRRARKVKKIYRHGRIWYEIPVT